MNQNSKLHYNRELLRTFLWVAIVAGCLLTAINLAEYFFDPTSQPGEVLLDLAADLMFLALLGWLGWLEKQGHTRLAAWLFLLGMLLAATFSMDLEATNEILFVHSLPVISASFLLFPAASFLFAILSIALYTLVWLNADGQTVAFGYGYFSTICTMAIAGVAWQISHRLIREVKSAQTLSNDLQVSNAHNQVLLDAITAILIGIDAEQRIIFWNHAAAATFDLPAEAVLGRTLASCPIRWDWPAVSQSLALYHQGQDAARSEDIAFTQVSGREGLLGLSFVPLPGEAGAQDGVLIAGRDVTEARLAEQQQTQTQKLKSIGLLAAGIAHEINTPLQYVSDNVHFLDSHFDRLMHWLAEYRAAVEQARPGLPAQSAAGLQAIEARLDCEFLQREIPLAIDQTLDGLGRVTRIVTAMKDFSHMGKTKKVWFDLNRAIESTLTVAHHELRQVPEVTASLDPRLPRAYGIPGEINQAVLNLLVNAVHAIADHPDPARRAAGRIAVTSQDLGDQVEITITDNGCGIPAEIQSQIFDPFFTTKEVGRGTGQGLGIVYQVVVEHHQGQVFFKSQVGLGSTFTIRLPAVRPD